MPFTVHPVGFLWVEPWTLGGQQPCEEPDSAFELYVVVVILDPGSDLLALVPSGLVPDHYQNPFSSFLSYRKQILYELQGVGAVGLTGAEAQMHFPTLMVQSTVTGHSLGFGIILALILLQKSH